MITTINEFRKIHETNSNTVILDMSSIFGTEATHGSVYQGTAKINDTKFKSYAEYGDEDWIGLPINAEASNFLLQQLGITKEHWLKNKQKFLYSFDTDTLFGKKFKLQFKNNLLYVEKILNEKKLNENTNTNLSVIRKFINVHSQQPDEQIKGIGEIVWEDENGKYVTTKPMSRTTIPLLRITSSNGKVAAYVLYDKGEFVEGMSTYKYVYEPTDEITSQKFEELKNQTSIKEGVINEMSYASIQQEIEDLEDQLKQLFQDQEAEAGQKGDKWTDADANVYGSMMNKIERKIETRKNYLNRLRSGSRKAAPKELIPGEKINYKGTEHTILYVIGPDSYGVAAKTHQPEVGLANTSDTTYKNKPVRVTNVEDGNVFINTWKDGGGFNNFANKISLNELDGIVVVPYAELQQTTTPKTPKAKTTHTPKSGLVSYLTKNIETIETSFRAYKDRTLEEQATIFKTRYGLNYSVEEIVAALKEMGFGTQTTESE